ncbi:MAG: SGNH/GDSL hydrolase family protein, partial [Deltaproteobacteria bacterium]|nr:SGNH/GDSL hydrolase family protein [Deltaproteobacteria bacterium]
MKKLGAQLLAASISLVLCFAILYAFRLALVETLRPFLFDYALLNMSEEDRRALYDEIGKGTLALWDTTPEHLVGKIGRRNRESVYKQAPVRFNNAGMRSEKPYRPKPAGVFRLICLGDSMVFGTGGAETDRYCDQIEAFYSSNRILVDGKRIETYAIGLPSWTAVQEATYLSSRISAYDPDVILVLTTSNDITDGDAVTGAGTTTHDFSPEHRDWGSAFFSNFAGAPFGVLAPGPLNTDLVPEARARWRKAMTAMKHLTELQHRRDRMILHSLMQLENHYFTEIYKDYFQKSGIEAPLLITSHFPKEGETSLPHDSHPNRAGHGIYAAHYVHALDRLGWVPVGSDALPELYENSSLDFEHPPDSEKLNRLRGEFEKAVLQSTLDFTEMKRIDTRSFLGGLLPHALGKAGLRSPPWATVRSAFALKRSPESRAVEVEIEIPQRPELFPFQLGFFLDGTRVQTYEFAVDESGKHTLRADLPPAQGVG